MKEVITLYSKLQSSFLLIYQNASQPGDHPFSTCSKFYEKYHSYLLIRRRACEYQGVRNVGFSINFSNALNRRSPECL